MQSIREKNGGCAQLARRSISGRHSCFFTLRHRGDNVLIRPISARYMLTKK
jgi:hypothetical protein